MPSVGLTVLVMSGLIYWWFVKSRINSPTSIPEKNTNKEADFSIRWETPAEIAEEVERYMSNARDTGSMEWDSSGCQVHVHLDKVHGIHSVNWTKNDDHVFVCKYWDGVIVQIWRFGDSTEVWIKLSDTTLFERWIMENASMNYYIREDWKHLSWDDDKRDVESVRKCKRYISSWCEQNRVWLRLPCLIYGSDESSLF